MLAGKAADRPGYLQALPQCLNRRFAATLLPPYECVFFSRQKLLVLLIALPIFAFGIAESWFSYDYFFNRRPANRFVLGDDYSGWAVVTYGNKDCPPVTVESEVRVHVFPDNGKICLSTLRDDGWGDDEYVYASAPEHNLMNDPKSGANRVWHELQLKTGGDISYYVFFIGDSALPRESVQKEFAMLMQELPGVIANP